MARRTLEASLAAALALSPAATLAASSGFGPSVEVAAQRGHQIFNSVSDSLRRWGQSVHPNGMSLFLATVPEGILFHHGNDRNATPTSLDWMAYEIEHAEMFARSKMGGPGGGGPPGGPPEGPPGEPFGDRLQAALGSNGDDDEPTYGWLHTYRTTRPLQFLYIDGMSGNKDDSGVIDTQDLILRLIGGAATTTEPSSQPTGRPGPPGEHQRALDLCQLCADWKLQGVIRTESPGIEIIKCDFFDGLEQVQSIQRVDGGMAGPGGPGGGPGRPGGGRRGPGGAPGSPGGPHGSPRGPRGPGGPGWGFSASSPEESFRDVGGRTLLDFSAMVSAFFFPVDLTNPDVPDAAESVRLPRLVNASGAQRRAIRDYLAQTVEARRGSMPQAAAHWRDVADLVVRRYAATLTAMANATASADELAAGIRFLLSVYEDYAEPDADRRDVAARQRCTDFYLQVKPVVTQADQLVRAGFAAVTADICGTLFDIKATVDAAGVATTTGTRTVRAKPAVLVDDDVLQAARKAVQQLVRRLDWSVFAVGREEV